MKAGNAYAYDVVIDLEFTPVPRMLQQNGLDQEIIEVGAVKLAPDGTVAGEFSHIVRPVLAQGVSGRIRQLTGIVNADLRCAQPLSEVLEALCAWIGTGRTRMVTWSGSDLRQIRKECVAKGIEAPLPHRWLDIQRLYPRLTGLRRGRKVALYEAADWCSIPNNRSEAHRALYDAQITARIFRMMADGECAEHLARMRSELSASTDAAPLASSIADRCAGLAGLLASLSASEVAGAA